MDIHIEQSIKCLKEKENQDGRTAKSRVLMYKLLELKCYENEIKRILRQRRNCRKEILSLWKIVFAEETCSNDDESSDDAESGIILKKFNVIFSYIR